MSDHTGALPALTDLREDPLADAIRWAFGDRCPDYSDTCAGCVAWRAYDQVRDMRFALEKIEQQLDYGQQDVALKIARTALAQGAKP